MIFARAIGSVVRVKVAADSNRESIEIELSRNRFDAVSPAHGDKAFIRPRQIRIVKKGT